MKAPKCRLCGSSHWSGEPHKWLEADITKESKPTKRVHNAPKECVHSPKEVYTIREVSIRQFRSKMAAELKDLPFNLVRSGKVVAVVREK